jgi:predicted ATPase
LPVAVLVDQLLGRCPRLRALATSRVALGLPGEAMLRVDGLGPDGVELFLDRARLVQPGAVDSGGECARAICALADELPLGIELAAAHARALPLPHILAGMSDRMGFLAGRGAGRGLRHSSVATSIAWSYQLVDDRARCVLRALSVLPGPFTIAAADGVCADRPIGDLEVLVDHSLVRFDVADGRYLLLDTIREFAAAELRVLGEADAVEGRLLDWAAQFAEAARPGLDRADPAALNHVTPTRRHRRRYGYDDGPIPGIRTNRTVFQ